jgi:hypothetical protein
MTSFLDGFQVTNYTVGDVLALRGRKYLTAFGKSELLTEELGLETYTNLSLLFDGKDAYSIVLYGSKEDDETRALYLDSLMDTISFTDEPKKSPTETISSAKPSPTAKPAPPPTPTPSAKPTPSPARTQSSGSGATAGQKNALSLAKRYLSVSAFSHEGLIDQLMYEKYSREDATYAADNCGADWNEQALSLAKSYLKISAFSYDGLIDQFEYEGFTSEQANYGADNCGADWNEEAVKKAAAYLKISSFSRSELISQLEYEGFTHEQAVYGAEGNGY